MKRKHESKLLLPNERADALESLINSVPMLISAQTSMAKISRAKYLALIDAGFTEAQALAMCK
jgi:hypothetical protein